jgi:cytochrome c oxidase subunit 2
MRRRISLLLVSALVVGGCELPSLGAPEPASEQGERIHDLWRAFAAAAVGVGVFVTVLLVYVVVRYRRRSDDLPDQRPYNIPVEVVYTVTPLVIVAVLFGFSVATQLDLDDRSERPDHRIEVVAFQWDWQFRYPEDDVVVTGTPGDMAELVLPVGRTTRLDLQTADVIHNFWVPRFLSKRDMIPGIDNEMDVTPTRVGVYEGVCAEFCGIDHARMRFRVRVLERQAFDAWLADAAEEPR